MGVKVLKRWFLIEHASFATTRHIDIGARGAVSRVYAHIYTAIYRTANHPYTRVFGSRVSKGHGVTG